MTWMAPPRPPETALNSSTTRNAGRLVLARPGRPVSPGRIGAGRVKGAKRRRRRGPLTREAPSGHPTGDRERPARQRKVVVGPRGLDDLDLLGPATTDQDGLAGLELAHRVWGRPDAGPVGPTTWRGTALYGNGPRARYCLGLEIYRNEPIPASGGPA